jgi:phospholipid/cholesterol/gamma-HCH transport system substrate-binding protein
MSDVPDPSRDAAAEALLQPPSAKASRHSTDNLEFKALLLLAFMLALVLGSAVYVMYARGVFESTQKLVLISEDSEGVVVGMNMTFSGFPIGRVQRIELADDGKARILIDVASKDAHWLREASVFTLVRGLVGSTNIRAYTGLLTGPLLPDGAVRTVLQGDAAAEVPKLIAAAKELIENVTSLVGSQGALGATFGNLQTLTTKINGSGGALGALLGNDVDSRKLLATLGQTNERVNTLLARLDGLAVKADTQVFGDKPGNLGLMPETRATVVQLNALLLDARTSLKKVDAVLVEAQAIGANAREATSDLGTLRGEVEASLRKVEGLVNEVNRKWPFARDTEVKLP